jgi:hypothetical protein
MLLNKVRKIADRSSPGTRSYLHHYANHEKFPELIDLLDNLPGRIYEFDITNAFASILMKGRPSSTSYKKGASTDENPAADSWKPLRSYSQS